MVTFQAEERKAVPGVRISESGSGKNIRRKKGRGASRREHSLASLTPLLFFLLMSLSAVHLEQAKAEEKKGKETLFYKDFIKRVVHTWDDDDNAYFLPFFQVTQSASRPCSVRVQSWRGRKRSWSVQDNNEKSSKSTVAINLKMLFLHLFTVVFSWKEIPNTPCT